MSSKNYFFTKLFEKSDEAESLYNNYDFLNLSEEERKFLDRLSIFTKYKSFFRKRLTSDNIGLNNKRRYIELNSGYMTYDEFIIVERCFQEFNQLFRNSAATFTYSTIALLILAIYKRPTGHPIMGDFAKILSGNIFLHLSYILYYRWNEYGPPISNVYKKLSRRLNLSESSKFDNIPENSKNNYFNVTLDNQI